MSNSVIIYLLVLDLFLGGINLVYEKLKNESFGYIFLIGWKFGVIMEVFDL